MTADETMLDAYIYETQQLLQSLENTLLQGEKEKELGTAQINEVFRVMHTIKGASSMMEYENMTKLSHVLEDMFSQIREHGAPADAWPVIFDLTFCAISFFNGELTKLLAGAPVDGDAAGLIERLREFLPRLEREGGSRPPRDEEKPSLPDCALQSVLSSAPGEPVYRLKVLFEKGCQMESLRAFGVVQSLARISRAIVTVPEDLNDDTATEEIRNSGLHLYIRTSENPDEIREIMDRALFVDSYSVLPVEGEQAEQNAAYASQPADLGGHHGASALHGDDGVPENIARQNFISVNVNKLDSLLDIVGEIVTAQSMVISSADFGDRQHDSFDVAAQQLHALINELQDVVMSIRMIPVSTLFQKMRRLVRDMGRKFEKDIELELIGEETEVDKNVIDYLADPLLHIIRNSVDHGIEYAADRLSAGKPARGKITLQAHTTGSDVVVSVMDDGGGLQRDTILKKAYEKGLISANEDEMSDQEVFSLIFMPGFSTKQEVSEYSGRGVGMDVVRKNISQIGGSITVDSEAGKGTSHTIRIPLTLTIADGMRFTVGHTSFIVPTVSICSVLQPETKDIFTDASGNEMIMLQGECYSLLRLNRVFQIEGGVNDLSQGIVMHVASERGSFCIFFDRLDGEYQVVVKTLPAYLRQHASRLGGLSGCAILGDGSISYILDVNEL